MSDASAVMFTPEGRASPYQLARWKAKGGLQPLQPRAQYVNNGAALPAYRALWAKAFPTRNPIPTQVATKDLRFTVPMLDVWS